MKMLIHKRKTTEFFVFNAYYFQVTTARIMVHGNEMPVKRSRYCQYLKETLLCPKPVLPK